jgi:hypothetical protein
MLNLRPEMCKTKLNHPNTSSYYKLATTKTTKSAITVGAYDLFIILILNLFFLGFIGLSFSNCKTLLIGNGVCGDYFWMSFMDVWNLFFKRV